MPRNSKAIMAMMAIVTLLNTALWAQSCGDCNLDGQVSILDALTTARIAAAILTATPQQQGVCDVDGSQTIDILDTLRIARFAAGLTGAPICRRPPVWSQLEDGQGPGVDHHIPVVQDIARGVLLAHTGDSGGTFSWNGSAWDRIPAPVSPTSRSNHCMAYDAARQEVVLFGGITNSLSGALGDTWLWNGSAWRQVITPASPQPRYNSQMVYDSQRGVVVLFGGYNGGIIFGDTWEWDGQTWAQRSSGTAPSPRHWHAMTFDSTRGVTILHGGAIAPAPSLGTWVVANDTWTWDGAAWTEMLSTVTPFGSGRCIHAMCLDETRGVVVLYGGWNGLSFSFEDTWEWDGVNWATTFPVTDPNLPLGQTPLERRGHSMVYDATLQAVLLIGGDGRGRRLGAMDLWSWDGQTWSALNPMGIPPPVFDYGLMFDPVEGETILLGGNTYLSFFNTVGVWHWDGQLWTPQFPSIHPLRRAGFGLAYDESRQRAVVFGGDRYSFLMTGMNDTWEKTSSGWLQRFPATAPPRRYDLAMAYDPIRDRTVVFGGAGATRTSLDDVWEWDGSVWMQRFATAPPPRHQATMVYAPFGGGGCFVFGGFSTLTGTYLQDLWQWNGSLWTQWTTPISPAARARFGMTFDSGLQEILLYGGEDGIGLLADTWTFDGASWSQRAVSPAPTARAGHKLAYDPTRGRAVLYGGESPTVEHLDTWEWDGLTWAQIALQTRYSKPSPRNSHAAAFDSTRNKLMIVGGQVNWSPHDGEDRQVTWTWSDSASWAPSVGGRQPGPRTAHSIAFDSLRQAVVLFGGQSRAGWSAPSGSLAYPFLGDTWEWNGNQWSEIFPVTAPPDTFSHTMSYDSWRGVSVLFGGAVIGVGVVADTWEWDGANWVQRFPATSPPPRTGHGMAFDSDRGVTVVFGGEASLSTYSGTWEWDGTNWRQVMVLVEPPSRSFGIMDFDPGLHATVLYGGLLSGPPWYLQDTWTWDGVAWSQIVSPVTPGPRLLSTLTYVPTSGGCVLFGGRSPTSYHSDLWILR